MKFSDNLWDLHKLYSMTLPYVTEFYQYNKQILKFLLLSIVSVSIQFSRKKWAQKLFLLLQHPNHK